MSEEKNVVLYIGGFELPDKNAAAHRVIGIAKGLKKIGYRVVFLNSLKNTKTQRKKRKYFGFDCFEYGREAAIDYLVTAKTASSMIRKIKPTSVIAYNYPAVALKNINKLCKKLGIKCYADVTEWYKVRAGNPVYAIVKNLDSWYRMKKVHKQLNGVIAISRYLCNYYKSSLKTVMIPPTVDISDEKWGDDIKIVNEYKTFIYAGSPSSTKEKLNVIVNAIIKASECNDVMLEIVGITKEQFVDMYSWITDIPDCIRFFGRLSHSETIEHVKCADWSIILRNNDDRVVKAGFPTKLVESISCGTPVIVNKFSNITDYLDENNSIIVGEKESLQYVINKAGNKSADIRRDIFDYSNYIKELETMFGKL